MTERASGRRHEQENILTKKKKLMNSSFKLTLYIDSAQMDYSKFFIFWYALPFSSLRMNHNKIEGTNPFKNKPGHHFVVNIVIG